MSDLAVSRGAAEASVDELLHKAAERIVDQFAPMRLRESPNDWALRSVHRLLADGLIEIGPGLSHE